MPLKSFTAILLFTSMVAGQRISSTGLNLPPYTTAQQATDAEIYLKSHPEDRTVVRMLLDYYEAHWQETQADRLRVILWTIQNHPNIDLDGVHDSRGLLLNPDDNANYQKARQLWLEQVRRYPNDPRVLENAAICLKLTDRESAVNWLRQAMALDPAGGGGRIVLALADVYAAAITGVTGINPWEGPTSLDPAEAGSAFALHAREEAAADAEVAARTGWALYLTTEAFHCLGLSDSDYDAVAEQLLLKSAAMMGPNPGFSLLGDFYNGQERKPSRQIYPKSRVVVVAPDEQNKRLVLSSKLTSNIASGEKTRLGTVTVVVDIVVGTDGHVWKANAKNAPSELIGGAASFAASRRFYQPLIDKGELVRVSTTVEEVVDARP